MLMIKFQVIFLYLIDKNKAACPALVQVVDTMGAAIKKVAPIPYVPFFSVPVTYRKVG